MFPTSDGGVLWVFPDVVSCCSVRFLTPSVTHSPIFQVMVGDHSVNLSNRFPFLVPSSKRARRLAKDPVAATDFFEFCVSTLFDHLFGWDYVLHKSKRCHGILGLLRAFYGTCEFTECGSLHAHFLIWLVSGANPNEILAGRVLMLCTAETSPQFRLYGYSHT
jgi:Helitron helicase-like domain at N-terminus